MIRISGVVVAEYKHAAIALTAIYGVGRTRARELCESADVPPAKKMGELNDEELARLRAGIAEMPVEGAMRREMAMSVKRLIDLNCYRGQRHRHGLPTRGQRTRTNARTRKGPRKIRLHKK
jgi:small subunit ribosomal protein S13